MPNEQPTPEQIHRAQAHVKSLLDNQLYDEAAIIAKRFGIQLTLGKIPQINEETERWLSLFITRNDRMIALKEQVRKLSLHQDSVLIFGESGTGKELLAHALHGQRKLERFIAINCAGMPEHLIESELFGHVKGAFTGASETKAGLFKAAHEGTLFLDEIGDLPLTLQAKFLRAIQERRIRRVGSNEEEPITCRIVAATHQRLEHLVKEGEFRLDLYARISTFELETLPLRYREEDIYPIVKSLDNSGKCDDSWCVCIKPQEHLPLNVRSLQRIVRRYLVLGLLP